MSATKASIQMLSLIRIKIDGEEFGRVRSSHSNTAAQLRVSLSENYRLPLNVYFLDIEGYRIAEEDEDTDTIEQLLDKNNIIQMRTDEIKQRQKTPVHSSNMKKQPNDVNNKYSTFIITESFSIIKYLWHFLVKPMIIVTLMVLLLYYGYTKLVCKHGHFLPFVTMFCPTEQSNFISIPPVSKVAENSASLADTLMNTDVSAPMRFVQAKISLIELRAQVTYSHIDANVKNKLSEQMLELQQLTQMGADQLTIMLGSFGSTLDKLRVYTQFALEELSEVINPRIHGAKNLLHIGYSEMEVKSKLTKSYESYMTLVSDQTDKILLKAQQASMSLENIKNKLEIIQELNIKGKHISETRIDELKYGSFWSWLFDEGKLGIAKHERNLKILDGFVDFVKLASNNVNDVIIKLKTFKHDAEDLKLTGIHLEELPHISVNRQAQLLEAALKRLTESKEKFEEKNQQNKLT